MFVLEIAAVIALIGFIFMMAVKLERQNTVFLSDEDIKRHIQRNRIKK